MQVGTFVIAMMLATGLGISVLPVSAQSVYDTSNYRQNYTTAQNAIQIAQTEVDLLPHLKQSALIWQIPLPHLGTCQALHRAIPNSSCPTSSYQRDKDMVSLFLTSTAEMQQAAQRRQEILILARTLQCGWTDTGNPGSRNTDVLIGQNLQVIDLMSAKGADSGAEKNESEAQAKYAGQVMRKYESRRRTAATVFR